MQELFELYDIEEADQEYFLELEKQAIIDAVNRSDKIKHTIVLGENSYLSPGEIYYQDTYFR